jgi:hypothetical protein
MRQAVIIYFVMLSFGVMAQPCKLLTQTFAIADTMQTDSNTLYKFRFSAGQLDDLSQLPDLAKAITALRKLQKTLDEDNASFQSGTLWQLDGKLAEKHLAALRIECPETGFGVFWREIVYYKSKFQKQGAPR